MTPENSIERPNEPSFCDPRLTCKIVLPASRPDLINSRRIDQAWQQKMLFVVVNGAFCVLPLSRRSPAH